IFGQIHRATTPKENTRLESAAYVNGRCVSHGYAIILSVTDKDIKIQLVGNTSYVNYAGADTYIDKMDLGMACLKKPEKLNWTGGTTYVPQSEYHKAFGTVDDTDMVLFWAYYKDPKDIIYDNLHNQRYPNSPWPTLSSAGDSQLDIMDLTQYSCQPYLLKVIERVVKAMGYTLRRNDLNHSWLRHLYIVNYKGNKSFWDWWMPDGSDEIGLPMVSALPHWPLNKFLDEVEKLCACVFVFNSYNNTVDIIQLDKFYGDTAEIYEVADDCILDEYEFEFTDSSEDKDIASCNISFKKGYTDKRLKVDKEVLAAIENHESYANYTELVAAYEAKTTIEKQKVLFIDDTTGREYICNTDDKGNNTLVEVNVFGEFIRDAEAGSVELDIVPANTRKFGVGWWVDPGFFMDPSAGLDLNVPFTEQQQADNPEYTTAQDIIDNSYTDEQKDESNDVMEVMLSTGQWFELASYRGTTYNYPAPFTDFNMPGATHGKLPEMSLSLKDVCEQSLGHMYRNIPRFNTSNTFVKKFLAKTVPDVRQPFMFHNQMYVCRKLNSDFETGTEDLIFEGEFYRIE
ncbi:MAG: hypothetical protein IJZ40_05885, partial [Bacteroidaceae bacterium]|nr:hypothetical protein [Bacteroidaceae bacterium]